MANSMTGYARREATHPWGTLIWELRSLNHRYLEPHFRLPEVLRPIEPELRARLRKRLYRGKVELTAHVQLEPAAGDSLDINLETARQVVAAAQQVNGLVDNPAPLNAFDVLNWPGVLSGETVDVEAVQRAALALFDECVKTLGEHRQREGAELAQFIGQRLDQITVEMEKVNEQLPQIMQAQRDKILERVAALNTDVNPDRLEQELVFYAQKADVEEELDRLATHVVEVRHTLSQSGAIGRRLDFLMQELNREANTLSSKSIASDTTQSAVELKLLIEQMREQIQNIE